MHRTLAAIRKDFTVLVHRIPSMLFRSDYRRIFQSIRLFGFTAVYKEATELLQSENSYIFEGDVEIIPVKRNNTKDLNVEDMPLESATISAVIPTKNAGENFRHLLSKINNQKGFGQVEIIVVDSGSTDKTVEIAAEFGAKLIQIQPEEFTHSFARNLGAEYACGDYLFFTVQDAMLPSNKWLHELLDVLRTNNIAAASCSEFPGKDADLFHRVAVWQFDKFMQIIEQDRILRRPNKENYFTLRMNSNLSNISCLISKEIFRAYKFRGDYAEDMDLGLRLTQDGHKLAFLGSIRIIHSHNRSAYYHLKRAYVDTRTLSQIFPDYVDPVGEIDLLFHDIMFTYNFVNSILISEIQRISLPCSIRKLAQIVMKAFHSAGSLRFPITSNLIDNEYIDDDFKSFLNDISCQCSFSTVHHSPAEGILFYKVRVYAMMTLEYLDNNYDLFDENLREEFKFFLFKLCALVFGTILSFSMLQGSKNTNGRLEKIHYELSSDV